MPKVSVVIPSYNHARFLGEAIESVLSQTEPDLELIVVDDGSTDDSVAVLASYSDPRIHVVTQSNQGAHAAINRGLALASGEFLAILNSDDAYHPSRLERCITVLENNDDIGLVASHISVVNTAGRQIGVKQGYHTLEPWPLRAPQTSFRAGTDLHAALLTENYLATTSNYVFPRRVYERVGTFRPLRYVHDWDFALRVARIAQIELIPEPLVYYRVHEDNTIRTNRPAMVFEICWCLATHLPNYVRDRGRLQVEPSSTHIEQLLSSIYTYGNDHVLAVMLLQNLAENPEVAERLLDPDNPERDVYLDVIRQGTGADASAERSGNLRHIRRFLAPHALGSRIRTLLRTIAP